MILVFSMVGPTASAQRNSFASYTLVCLTSSLDTGHGGLTRLPIPALISCLPLLDKNILLHLSG